MTVHHLKTREQRIVAVLERDLPKKRSALEGVRARARSLPAMLRRHGPLQVLTFLDAKTEADGKLARWLLAGTLAALGEEPAPDALPKPRDFAAELAALDLPAYLLRWEATLEAGGWLKMLIEARTPKNGAAKPAPGGAAQKGAPAS